MLRDIHLLCIVRLWDVLEGGGAGAPMSYFHFEQEAHILRARLDEVRWTSEPA